jgi:ketosteroid isomerase-like protein
VPVPEIIDRYLQTATGTDFAAMAACFTEDAAVTDEGKTHHGRQEIRAWREQLAATFEYTVTVLGADPGDDGRYRVTALIEGNFPGGRVELTYAFRLREGLISELVIG